MNKLQKVFNRALRETGKSLQIEIMRQKFLEAGVSLTDKQITEVIARLKAGESTLQIEDEQVDMSRVTTPGKLHIEFKEGELDGIFEQLPNIVEDTIQGFAEATLKDLKKKLQTHISTIKDDRGAFNSRLWNRWRKPLELFHLYLAVTNEAAGAFNKFHRSRAAKKNDLVFDVLMRLQARGCQIALEVLTLLESGLADGAHARWRSLHEITCVAMFVRQHGQDVANRYLLYDLVQAYKSGKQYHESSIALGHRPLSKRTLSSLQRNHQIVEKQFGKSFCKEYGWAAKELGKERVFFNDIEKAVGLEKLRPYYSWASDNVHANVRATQFKLGLPGRAGMLLAGSSDAGLADPGNGAAMSLFQLTITLLTSKPNMDTLVMCAVLRRLEREIGSEFLKVHKTFIKQQPTKRTRKIKQV